ncbi:MAG: molybdopterin-dependent oxidoreductase [Actinomycetota bacterium]
MSLGRWWPRRADGLPPGQRLLTEMPRFSDAPMRWAPAVPEHPTLTVRHGEHTVSLPLDAIDELDRIEIVADFHCVTTWSVRDLRWSGVRVRDVLRRHLGDERPTPFARVHAGDGAIARYVIDDLLSDDVLLATQLNGEPLTLRHGAPLRLVCPGQYGYKNAKHVTEIEFCDSEPDSAYGGKEHLRGRVAREERHGRLPNWVVRWPYRLAVPITARLADRALAQKPNGHSFS